MAKSQKHGNREVRKPKTAKPVTVAATSNLSMKGAPTLLGIVKKKP